MGKLLQSQRVRLSLAAVGGGLTVVLIGAGALTLAGSAFAGSASPSPATSGSTAAPAPGPNGQGHGPARMGRGLDGLLGGGLGQVLHGTGVVKAPDGTFQSMAVQRGAVTAVSATSISVKSLDGYTATYVVNSATKVNGKNGKITDVKIGDQVAVVATVSSNTSTATRVIDLTNVAKDWKNFEHRMHQWFGQWAPGGKKGATPAPTPSTSPTA